MSSFDGSYLTGKPVAQLAWRQRQIRIARAVLSGTPVATVAAEERVSGERIRQIVRMACVHSVRVPSRKVQLPMQDRWSMASFRGHKDFWLARLSALERAWKLRS